MRKARWSLTVALATLFCACGQQAAPWEYAELGGTTQGNGAQTWWWEEGAEPQVMASTMADLGKKLGAGGAPPHTTALVNLQAAKGWELMALELDSRAGATECRWMFRRARR